MDEAKMVAQLISVRPTNGWSLGDEVTRRDIEILRHCEEVVRTMSECTTTSGGARRSRGWCYNYENPLKQGGW
jgi:hypothetical protein